MGYNGWEGSGTMEENGVMVYLLFFLWKFPLEIQRFLWEMNEHNPFTDSQSLIFPMKQDDFPLPS